MDDAREKTKPSPVAGAPSVGDIQRLSDTYFLRSKETVRRFGDKRVTYAIFMRRPVICTPRLALDWLSMVARDRGTKFDIDLRYR